MKFEAGQIVSSGLSNGAAWYFIITEVLPKKKESSTQYYECYCFKTFSENVRRDLHLTIQMSEDVLSEV
jgi:hypothetical protein